MVLHRADNAAAFHYAAPVVVLIDGGCFSATDVFVAALRTRPQVRLCGTATSGGSGRARTYRLARSGIALQLSSMASFRPDGKLFEGNGIEPDVHCEPAPQDLVSSSDAVLAAAARLVR
jgi:C-terminal processing protease CtpA/Prc